MTTPTTVIVHFWAKPGFEKDLGTFIMPAIPRLTELSGCRGGSLYYDIDEPRLYVLVEHWESREAHQRYIAQIESDGTMDRMRPMLEKEPDRRYMAGASK